MTSPANDQIYCFKCRSKTDTLEAQEVVLKNGRPAVTGQCVACGTKKFRMGASQDYDQWDEGNLWRSCSLQSWLVWSGYLEPS